MTGFLLDLVHDLKEKRLVPVAIGLLVALVAVPVVLMKPGGGSAGGDPAPSATAPSAGATPSVVQSVEDGSGPGASDLGVFDPKNPFKSGVKVKKPAAADGVAQLVKPEGNRLPASVDGSPVTGGGTGGGATNTPSSTPSPTPSPSPVTPPVTKSYTYVVDVKFGQTGDERTRKGLKRLGILPNDRNPMVVFLGVSSDVKRAVFLVDTRASQSGEGACRPSLKSCTFLYLRDKQDRDEQFVTDEQGREYHLTLLAIRRVEVKRSSRTIAKTSRRRVSARDAAGAKTRVVEFPLFAPDVER